MVMTASEKLAKRRKRCVQKHYEGRTIVIYGAGENAQATIEIAQEMTDSIVVCDKDWERIRQVGNYSVVDPGFLAGNRSKYYVLVSILKEYQDVREFLEHCGFCDEKDYCYWSLTLYKSIFAQKYPNGYDDSWGNRIIGDLNGATVKFLGVDSTIEVQEGFKGNGTIITVYSGVNLEVGEDVTVNHGRWLFFDDTKCRIGKRCNFIGSGSITLWPSSYLDIGDFGSFQIRYFFATISNAKVIVGKDALFARGVTVRSGDGHPLYDLLSGKRLPEKKYVILHDHVWVGQETIILGDTEIETGCMIGAKSLVKGDFPNNVMIAGQMARIIRKNIAWSKEPLEYGVEDLPKKYRQLTIDAPEEE